VALARALFATVEPEETIPREHFEAVAKVIGFVLNTAKGKRR
jgi:flagellar biosynthetic protein FlhB